MRHPCITMSGGKAALNLALALLGVACALSGCGPLGDGTNARAMGRHVGLEYGKAELVGEEHNGNTAVYTYQDREYGFTYQVSARRSRTWFDGPLPWYHTVRDSDFEEQYYTCMTGLLEEDIREVEARCHVEVEPADIRKGGHTVRSFGLAEVSPEDTGRAGGTDRKATPGPGSGMRGRGKAVCGERHLRLLGRGARVCL